MISAVARCFGSIVHLYEESPNGRAGGLIALGFHSGPQAISSTLRIFWGQGFLLFHILTVLGILLPTTLLLGVALTILRP